MYQAGSHPWKKTITGSGSGAFAFGSDGEKTFRSKQSSDWYVGTSGSPLGLPAWTQAGPQARADLGAGPLISS